MSRLTNVKKKNPKQRIVVKDYADTFQYDEIYESRIVLQLLKDSSKITRLQSKVSKNECG